MGRDLASKPAHTDRAGVRSIPSAIVGATGDNRFAAAALPQNEVAIAAAGIVAGSERRSLRGAIPSPAKDEPPSFRVVGIDMPPKKFAEPAVKASLLPLPQSDATRWSARRKAAVVLAARGGVLSREEACRRYLLSPEELAAWEAALDRYGLPGLRSTRQQSYREGLNGHPRGRARRN